MKDWFNSLEQRERIFVGAGIVVVALALFYVAVWMPLERSRVALATNIALWEQSLAELRPLRGIQPATTSDTRISPANAQQTPVVIVDQSLRARGLDRSLKRSQPTTSNGIRVEFENVAFDDLVLWLGDLSRQYAMDVTSGSFSTTSRAEVGRISATLTLERTL